MEAALPPRGRGGLMHFVLYLEGNMKMAMDYIDEHLPNMRYMKPDASYLLWLDIRDYQFSQAGIETESA